LCRLENAKTLHVTDIDGALTGHPVNTETIQRMVKSVDIPISVGGGLRTFDDIRTAFELGAYRVRIATMMIDNPDEAARAVETYGSSKVILSIDAMDGIAATRGWTESSGLPALTVALNARAVGFTRVVYTDIRLDGMLRGVNLDMLRVLGEKSGMRVTSSGGIGGLDDMMKIQALEHLGVDSVVIGRALYQNRFPCQALWRMCEARNYPYTARV